MTPNHPIPEDLQKKIEQEAELYSGVMIWIDKRIPLDNLPSTQENEFFEYISRESHIAGATSYALKLDIAMKALVNISVLGYEYPVGSAIEIADRALKQLNNGE